MRDHLTLHETLWQAYVAHHTNDKLEAMYLLVLLARRVTALHDRRRSTLGQED